MVHCLGLLHVNQSIDRSV